MNHIEIKDLTVSYKGHKALNNISVNIPDKKVTAIIGPSGCGKTTLLKSLNRLLELNDGVTVEGQVLIDGEDIYGPKTEVTHLRKKVGLLAQRPQALPMSIYENVAYGPRIHGKKERKTLDALIEDKLRLAGLWDEVKGRLSHPASTLSIGQQQRLCLARSLAVEPEVILGDEPTSALDPISAEHIENKFLELRGRYTIVLVTHSLRQARKLADYVLFMYLGNLIEHAPAEEFFNNPRFAKTKAYINGQSIVEHKPDREIDLKGTTCPGNFVHAKLALEELSEGQILRIIADHEQAITEMPRAIEFEGHRVLEVKRLNPTDWEVLVQKSGEADF
jgi:phosphate transport system ATP-binding protein